MKLASYRGTRAFPNGIANILIRLRLRGDYSHSELIFEPSDLVDQYLPDKNSSETSEGLWAFSSVAAENYLSIQRYVVPKSVVSDLKE